MKKEQGFIKMIIIIVVALVVLGYFGINVRSIVDSPTTQSNLEYFKEIIWWIWNTLIKIPAIFIWNQIVMPIVQMISNS